MHKDDDDLCQMDMHLISQMLGVVPRLLSRISNDDESCRYLIPSP
jgi:predicted ArsR family transcriptional regulator